MSAASRPSKPKCATRSIWRPWHWPAICRILPVIADPSHGTGKQSLIAAVSRAAVAVGADGLIIEVHPCPERALSDGAQSLDFAGFGKVMRSLAEPLRQTASLPAAVTAAS